MPYFIDEIQNLSFQKICQKIIRLKIIINDETHIDVVFMFNVNDHLMSNSYMKKMIEFLDWLIDWLGNQKG